MENLVILDNKQAVVRTIDLYEGFGYLIHKDLKRVIYDNMTRFTDIGLCPLERTKPNKGSKGGRPEESFLLNERQFILLVMLAKNTKSSIELKTRVEKEFFRLRESLSKTNDYLKVRQDGKQVYHQKSDTIKLFVDYATEQGSSNAKMYYANLANMENSALFFLEQKYPNVREVLSIRQLMQVATADQIVEKSLIEGMENNLHYKDIYKLAKDNVISFSNLIGKSMVIELLGEDTNKLIFSK